MDEAQTISAAQKGDLSSFNRLVMTYQGLAYNVAYRIMGDTDSASDATQDAFIKAFKSINQYQGGAFKSWLMRIVTNTCYDQLRYNNRRLTEALVEEDSEEAFAPYLIDDTEMPEDMTVRHELSTLLEACIQKLPPEQRVILVLKDVEGFNYQEIAEIVEINLGTVKSRLNRARTKLRDILQQQELLPQQYRLQD